MARGPRGAPCIVHGVTPPSSAPSGPRPSPSPSPSPSLPSAPRIVLWRCALGIVLVAPLGASRLITRSPVIAASDTTRPARSDPRTSTAEPQSRQWVEMRNVDLHLTEQVVLRVRTLHGEVLRTQADRPAALDDQNSFRIRVISGTAALTGSDLGALLNTVVFAYPNAPLRDLQVRTDSSEIIQTGVIHKGVDLRFRLRGTVSLTPEGLIRIHPTAVRILGVNGEKLMKMAGVHLDALLDLSKSRGATVKGDDLFLNPTAILPPPAIDGRLAAIRVEGPLVVQDFVRLPEDSAFARHVPPDSADPNFIYFRGGQLRFGKLLMTDTDLRIIDADPKTPFDMSLPHYTRQLVAGTSHTTPSLGLKVYMPDYAALQARDSARDSARASRTRTRQAD